MVSESLWVDPPRLLESDYLIPNLAKQLGISTEKLTKQLTQYKTRNFLYLKRHADPKLVEKIKQEDYPGVHIQAEYKRIYSPDVATATANLIGFTNIDDVGQEGLEYAYDDRLRGSQKIEHVIKDLKGRTISFKNKVSGEDPNNRKNMKSANIRNRCITDIYEPGFGILPFVIATALENNALTQEALIDTSPGYLKLREHKISDPIVYGKMEVFNLLAKKSKVAAAKLALSLDTDSLFSLITRFGFNRRATSDFPGEASGNHIREAFLNKRDIQKASFGLGYGTAVTPIQLARAYSILANGGFYQTVKLVQGSSIEEKSASFSSCTAEDVMHLLRKADQANSRTLLSRMNGYSYYSTAAVHGVGGYAEGRARGIYVGFAPVDKPQFVVLALINDIDEKNLDPLKLKTGIIARLINETLKTMDASPNVPLTLPKAS